MKEGEQLHLTDGKGSLVTASITHAHKKHGEVNVLSVDMQPAISTKVSIAISLLKNASRFEWFLEKATEIGVREIVPMICERTERQHFRKERLEGVLISAMIQSRQTWLPSLHEPVLFDRFIGNQPTNTNLFIAHCDEQHKESLRTANRINPASLICIGPEGDFSKNEIELALKNKYQPVSLGQTRLRTETAGMVAAALLCV